MIIAIGTGSAVAATTYVPNRFDDPGPAGTNCAPPAPPNGCSLRGAIDTAHDGDTVQLAAGTYTLSLGSLTFTKSITIAGAGPQVTTVKQTGQAHVFEMDSSTLTWALRGMTITGGNAVGASGANGSGAGADGDLGSSVEGGGIETLGPLSLTDVVVTGNKVTGGDGGKGAAGNASNAGGSGGDGGTASGGGIVAFAPLTLVRVAVTDNTAQGGAAGTGGHGGAGTAGGKGGIGGSADAGGVSMGVGKALTAVDTLIAGNEATPAPGAKGGAGGTSKGAGGSGGIGGSGDGGGLDSLGPVNLTNVTFSGNLAGSAAGGPGGNARGSSAPSDGGMGGTGGPGIGGAIVMVNGGAGHLASVTIAGNTALTGPGGPGGHGSDGGADGGNGVASGAFGGNVSLINASLQTRDSIIANGRAESGDENCRLIAGSTLTSLGHNLEDRHQCISSPGVGDRLDTPAGLGPLQNNGGPTETVALSAGSAAIRGGEVGCVDAAGLPLGADQRGLPRPLTCDIGAFQGQPPVARTAPSVSGSAVVNQRLNCVAGTFTGDPSSSSFAWLRDGVAIAGATGLQYLVAPGDVGHTLACRQGVSNPYGAASATSVALLGFRPSLTALRLSPRKVRNGHKEKISFTLSAADRVGFTLHRLAPGTKVGRRCVARTGRHRHGRKCTRHAKSHGGPRSLDALAGSSKVSWKPHGLSPGKYELTATAADGDGQTVKFTVRASRKRHRK